jgi:hypothetical protein
MARRNQERDVLEADRFSRQMIERGSRELLKALMWQHPAIVDGLQRLNGVVLRKGDV